MTITLSQKARSFRFEVSNLVKRLKKGDSEAQEELVVLLNSERDVDCLEAVEDLVEEMEGFLSSDEFLEKSLEDFDLPDFDEEDEDEDEEEDDEEEEDLESSFERTAEFFERRGLTEEAKMMKVDLETLSRKELEKLADTLSATIHREKIFGPPNHFGFLKVNLAKELVQETLMEEPMKVFEVAREMKRRGKTDLSTCLMDIYKVWKKGDPDEILAFLELEELNDVCSFLEGQGKNPDASFMNRRLLIFFRLLTERIVSFLLTSQVKKKEISEKIFVEYLRERNSRAKSGLFNRAKEALSDVYIYYPVCGIFAIQRLIDRGELPPEVVGYIGSEKIQEIAKDGKPVMALVSAVRTPRRVEIFGNGGESHHNGNGNGRPAPRTGKTAKTREKEREKKNTEIVNVPVSNPDKDRARSKRERKLLSKDR